jgi:hypothetical protein
MPTPGKTATTSTRSSDDIPKWGDRSRPRRLADMDMDPNMYRFSPDGWNGRVPGTDNFDAGLVPDQIDRVPFVPDRQAESLRRGGKLSHRGSIKRRDEGGVVDPTTSPDGTAKDVVRGAGVGAIKGASTILGLPTDVWQFLDRGYQWALTRGAEKMGILTPEQGAALRQPIPKAEDYGTGSDNINQHLLSLAQQLGADTSEPTTVRGDYAKDIASRAVLLGAGYAGGPRRASGGDNRAFCGIG